jgi:hypothetical protein
MSMQEDWEICEKKRRKRRRAPRVYVSVNRRGEIALNPEAFKRIGSPASVALLYNAKQRVIGVKYPVREDLHFFLARRYGRDRKMRVVRAGQLLKQFDIGIEKTLAYANPETISHNGNPMLLLPLDAGQIVSRTKAEHREPRTPRATETDDKGRAASESAAEQDT